MSWLFAEKCYRVAGSDCKSISRTCRSIQPAWHIDTENRNAAGVDCRDEVRRRTVEPSRQPGPEQRINDEMHALQCVFVGWPNRKFILACHFSGIALQGGFVTEQMNASIEPTPSQQPRRHKAIAAVIARTAQHCDARAR